MGNGNGNGQIDTHHFSWIDVLLSLLFTGHLPL